MQESPEKSASYSPGLENNMKEMEDDYEEGNEEEHNEENYEGNDEGHNEDNNDDNESINEEVNKVLFILFRSHLHLARRAKKRHMQK